MVALLASLLLALSGCGKKADTAPEASAPTKGAPAKDTGDEKPAAGKEDSADAKAGADKDEDERGEKGKEAITLTPEQLDKLGVTTQPAQTTAYREETTGYGVVLEHQLIAQAVAEQQSAQVSAHFSAAALERVRRLHDTPGAMSADLEQTAEQKSAVDSAALTLSTEKLSSIWGIKPPWGEDIHDSRVPALAHGDLQLLKVTFPLGTIATLPAELHGGRIGGSLTEASARLHPVWPAPADATIPGRSYFTVMPAGAFAEGERLQAWAPTGEPVSGVLIPAAAVVLNAGKFWCYVQGQSGAFTHAEVDTSKPTAGGYVVTEGVKAGDKIAVTGAAELLAKETGSTEEPD